MPRNRSAGFTLIEAAIALAIAALVLAVFFEAAATGIAAVDTAGRTAIALAHARSHIAAIGPTARPGITEGDTGDGFHWRETTTRIAAHDSGLTLLDTSVDIIWQRAGRPHAVRLTTRHLAPNR